MQKKQPAWFMHLALAAALLPACASAPPAARTLQASPSRFADYDGIRVHYKVLGRGAPTLVFLPGWASDMRVWRLQAAGPPQDQRCIFLDLPGHGASDKPEREYSMDFLARSVAAVLRREAAGPVVLVGHSNGVSVARQFLRLYPGWTRGLVLVDGALRLPEGVREQQEAALAIFRGNQYQEVLAGMAAQLAPEGWQEELVEMMLSVPQPVIAGTLEAMMDPAIWEDDPVTVPTLVLLARQPAWDESYELFVRELVPDLDYRILDGVGHFLMIERPEVFRTALQEYLRRL